MKSMNVQELYKLMKDGSDLTLVDCREQNEWDDGHIAGATLIPLSTFETATEKLDKNSNSPIVIQCRSGGRSAKACKILADAGFETPYNLEGGILAWKEQGYEVQYPD